MCGIAIMVNRDNQPPPAELLKQMTDRVKHRGPDGEGYYIEGKVGLGHRRLAIIDLTETGSQPMFFEKLSLIFNGEIYNYIELREELRKLGYTFTSQSDSEVLLKAYHCWGYDCVTKLRGMWAFAIHDEDKQVVFLSRDRFGIKPLHFTQTPTAFLAGSEIKQFLALKDFCTEIYEPALHDFLQFGLLNHNQHTFFNNVFSL